MRTPTLERLRQVVSSHAAAPPGVGRARAVVDDRSAPLAEILKGEWVETSDGAVFIRDQWFALSHAHGAHALAAALQCDSAAFSMLASGGYDATPDAERCGFFDIETTGLSGGTGTYVVLAALGTFERVIPAEEPAFRLRQYFLAGPHHERAMLGLIAEDLAGCDALVTYNGRAFDVPVMESRFTLSRIVSPCREMAQVDLLHAMRRLYGHRTSGCRLADAERLLLRIDRPDDVPGYLIPQLYREYLVAGRVGPLRGVFRHNAEDVLSLVGILVALTSLLSGDWHEPEDGVAVARWHESVGDPLRAMRLYEAALPWLEGSETWVWAASRQAMLHKRHGCREEAAALWQQLWLAGDVAAGIELAKHLEHSAREFSAAERLVREIQERVDINDQLVSHRLSRIRRKLGRS